MPLVLAGGYGQAMSKPQRQHHREPAKQHASIATHREGLVTILGNLASGASKVVGEDLRVATVAALTQIITDLRRDATNLDPVGAVGDGSPEIRSARSGTGCRRFCRIGRESVPEECIRVYHVAVNFN